MPYIRKEDRERLDSILAPVIDRMVGRDVNAGELNYIYTMLALQYVHSKGLNYRTLNEVIGVFEAAKLEFYRRLVAPYEDGKISKNGDVYKP